MAMEAMMSSSFATHRTPHPPSSSFWGHGDSARFNCEGCGCVVKPGGRARSGAGVVTAYLERQSNPIAQFFGRLQGNLPIVGLLSRMMSDEGGVGDDRILPVEFCRKVEKTCSYDTSQAFYEFQLRHGLILLWICKSLYSPLAEVSQDQQGNEMDHVKVAKPQFVLLWCWAAAVGAGLLKTDDLLMSAARLRCSNDIQYETENLELLMNDAQKRRLNAKSGPINVPIEVRAEKALDSIMKCCVGAPFLEGEDVPLLTAILTAVFPSADASEVEKIVASRVGDDESSLEDDTAELGTEDELLEDRADARWAQ